MKYPQLVSMPSAVSDWLEEQLEARGIDAIVYTRYVLSLLHRDSLDLICPDQDIHITKETTARGRKRFRRSTYNDWWSHVCADVEQLRRSAAVECLMSASDQKCGIESLVDELCEKLKDFQSNVSENKDNSDKPQPEHCLDSPLDLAKRYYAAFPPLKSGSNLITLIPHLCSKRKSTRKIAQNRSNSCSEKYIRKSEIDNNMKSRSGGKSRICNLSRSKKDFGFTRSMEKSADLSDWDIYFMNRQNRADEGYSTSDTNCVDEPEEICDRGKCIEEDTHLAKLVAKFDRSIEALWNNNESCAVDNQVNEYQDLPVDLQELLASPIKQNSVRCVNNNKTIPFIQCGTNITSSIWSDYNNSENDAEEKSLYDSYCNLYNETLESNADKILGDQFNYLSVGMDKINDLFASRIDQNVTENETNMLYENFNENNNKLANKPALPWELSYPLERNKKWSDGENFNYMNDLKFCSPLNGVSKQVNKSLQTLNHNDEVSCFKEVVPKQVLGVPTFTPLLNDNAGNLGEEQTDTKEEEDLLTSARTHFRPIKQENTEGGGIPPGQYADGTTFAIRSSLEQVNYKRSDSGTLYLESEFDTPKKYMEYRVKDAQQDQTKCDTDNDSCYSIEREFILKFCVKQNEKCCQTELPSDSETSSSPQEVPAKKRVLCDPEEFFFPGDEELLSDSMMNTSEEVCECDCSLIRNKLSTNLEPLFNASSELCSIHSNRADSTLEEISQWSNNWKKCDKCNNNWSSIWLKPEQDGIWKSGVHSWQQIWSSSEELCRTCLGVPAGSGAQNGRSVEYFKLREELSQDGEQLLSDLSCLQRVYMEQLPVTEVSCDLNDCLSLGPPSATKERKRRHSSSLRTCGAGIISATTVARNSWTNATSHMRVGAEYLVEKSPFATAPSLRPVTL